MAGTEIPLAFSRGMCIIVRYASEYGLVAQLGERSVRIREVEGSNPFRSTKQVLDEHLFLQRRLRREVFALIQNRKAPSWEKSQGGAFSIFLGLVYFLSYAIY